jgi:hypothetical protein
MPALLRFLRDEKRLGIRHKRTQTGYMYVKVSLPIKLAASAASVF